VFEKDDVKEWPGKAKEFINEIEILTLKIIEGSK